MRPRQLKRLPASFPKEKRSSSISGQRKIGCEGEWKSPPLLISSDGQKVAFASTATNLAPGAKQGEVNIYVRELPTANQVDLEGGVGGPVADADATNPQISSSGNAVVFESSAIQTEPPGHGSTTGLIS